MSRKKLWLCALAVGALTACQGNAVRQCSELLDAESWETAAATCEEAFTETGDPRSGAAASRAHLALDHRDDVLAWVERLEGTAAEADARNLAARVHAQRGETELADEAYRLALDLARESRDSAQTAASLYGLCLLAWSGSDFRQAVEWAHAAAEEASKAEDPVMEAKVLGALLILQYDLGDLQGARRSLAAAEALIGPEEPLEWTRLLVFEGAIRLDEGRPALARGALEKALDVVPGIEDRRLLRSLHLNLVRSHLDLGDLEPARRHLAAAWEHAEPDGRKQTALLYFQALLEHRQGRWDEAAVTLETALGQDPSPDWVWELEHHRGTVEEARGEIRSAEEAFEHAAEIVEEMRGSLGFDDLKAWLLDRKREPYEALFRLRAEAGRAREALATAERARARSFLDAFIHAAAGPELSTSAAERLALLHELLPAMNESPVVTLRPLEQVLDAAGDRHLLVYFLAGDRSWLITVAERRVELRALEASPAEVGELVSRFLADPDDASLAAALGQLLLPTGSPGGGQMRDSVPEPGATLHVVADGVLGRLPFAALRRQGRYVVEDHDVTYVPSLNALAALEEHRSPGAGPPVVLGNPRGDLPAAALEAQEVAARLAVTARTGDAADSESLSGAARTRVLHLATHTGVGPGGPWLALADGDVNAGAIVGQRLAPRLVVLAGCASAARRGRGMWGSLGAAFLAAGSREVLASLWSIEDEQGRRFVLRFYGEGGADDAAAALGRAQRAFIAADEPPSFWAPFVVLGPGRR